VYPWRIVADVQGDSASGIIQGVFSAQIDNTLDNSSPKALLSALSGLSFGPAIPTAPNAEGSLGGVFGLVVRVTFGVGNSSNYANMYDFHLEN